MEIDWKEVFAFIIALGLFVQNYLNGRKTDKTDAKVDAVKTDVKEVKDATEAQSDELVLQTDMMRGDADARAKPSPIKSLAKKRQK